MSFQERLNKERGKVTSTDSCPVVPSSVITEENNFPFDRIDFVRLGSAHAKEERSNRADLRKIIATIAHDIERKYQPEKEPSTVEIIDK
ncbi:hypothetical protein K2X85_19000 [bacterium]|nr:hypothetical protein [bacterium]